MALSVEKLEVTGIKLELEARYGDLMGVIDITFANFAVGRISYAKLGEIAVGERADRHIDAGDWRFDFRECLLWYSEREKNTEVRECLAAICAKWMTRLFRNAEGVPS